MASKPQQQSSIPRRFSFPHIHRKVLASNSGDLYRLIGFKIMDVACYGKRPWHLYILPGSTRTPLRNRHYRHVYKGQATRTKRPHLYKNGQNLTRKYITISSRMRHIEGMKEEKKSRAGPEKEDKVEGINNANRSQITNNRDEIIYCSLLLNNLSDKSHLIYNTPKRKKWEVAAAKMKTKKKQTKEGKKIWRRISQYWCGWLEAMKQKKNLKSWLYEFFIHAEISPYTININLKSHKIRNRNVKNSLFLFIFC